jgi:hypothetical protein
MIRRHIIRLLFVVICILIASNALTEETKPMPHWYRLEIQTGDTTYQCIGSSTLEEQEFASQLAGTEFIALDDVSYIDPNGKIRSWQEWDPKALPRLYVNPQYVILFNPMKDDPKKGTSPKATKSK